MIIGCVCTTALSSTTLSGCNAEKARTLQTAAAQFRSESFAAIEAIDTLRQRELEAPPRNGLDARQTTVRSILNAKSDINPTLIELALNPNRPPQDDEWDAFIVDLKSQYDGFAGIFEQLDQSPIVGQKDVRASAEYAQRLTVQMALLSDALQKNPPVLTQYRSKVIVNLRQIRQEYQQIQTGVPPRSTFGTPTARQLELENQAAEALNEWQRIKQQEQQLLEATITQCTKAVTIGKEVIDLANRYDTLSLNDLNGALPRLFSTVSSLTGRDYSRTQSKLNRLLNDIKTDPLWRPVTQQFLNQVNNATNSRMPTATTAPPVPALVR
jgi:hypothetical protein